MRFDDKPPLGVVCNSTLSGNIIHHLDPTSRQYIGSPSIAILPDGIYVASHDVFGPGSKEFQSGSTFVYLSENQGETWTLASRIENAFWSSLFVQGDALYLFGLTHHHGQIVIRRSLDQGHTWTEPMCMRTGKLTEGGQYHTGPMPILVHRGRIWRAVEDASSGTTWGVRYNPLLMSAPSGSDLLDRDNWTFSTMSVQSPAWLGGRFGGWLEGNAVALPDGRVGNLLRVEYPPGGKAALTILSPNGHDLEFSPESGFIDLPGASTKFAVRQDPVAGGYWTLSNAVPPRHSAAKDNHAAIRNTLALFWSPDLRSWKIRHVLLYHPDVNRRAFQYVDWLFDNDDLVFVSRTAWDDQHGGAPNEHDANFLTFHRITNFRTLRMADSFVNPFTPDDHSCPAGMPVQSPC